MPERCLDGLRNGGDAKRSQQCIVGMLRTVRDKMVGTEKMDKDEAKEQKSETSVDSSASEELSVVSDKFPLPRIDEILDSISNKNKIFTSLDLTQGYHQVKIAEGDVYKTAISTTECGSYEYLRVPFGLKTSSSALCRPLLHLLRGLNNIIHFVEDVIAMDKDPEDHLVTLAKVFEKFREDNVYTVIPIDKEGSARFFQQSETTQPVRPKQKCSCLPPSCAPGRATPQQTKHSRIHDALKQFPSPSSSLESQSSQVSQTHSLPNWNLPPSFLFQESQCSQTQDDDLSSEDENEKCIPPRFGGTGKSVVIKVIRNILCHHFSKDKCPVIVMAPIGLAAYSIKGETIHRCFSLPVDQAGASKYSELYTEQLLTLRAILQKTHLFIIDEISMVSALAFIATNEEIADKYIELVALGKTPVILMPKNVDCRSVNETLLAKTSDNISTFTAIDRLSTVLRDKRIEAEAAENVKSFENDSKRTAGSISHLKLALGTRVMLQRNINVEEGLVNGSMGYVKGFKMTAANRAVGIQVQFDRQDKIVEIERETLKFEALKEVYYTRRQFPLTLAYAITIHKSQGLSLQTALVDAGDRCFGPGMIYLALSRVTMSEGLHLIDLDRRKSCADTEALVEYNRLRQKYRPDVPQKDPGKALEALCCVNGFILFKILIPKEENE
ncbi:hypothetical protein QYM36_020081 [Artemia franciscana]|uniref:ATP-dependent DNA helicase n=1 Tax=Artemia franciscana TaxID=6661 RepID=A0AA88H9B8_ARTSF|nr:hypothetical protein QYM36_020081 [Artemia franciscana]